MSKWNFEIPKYTPHQYSFFAHECHRGNIPIYTHQSGARLYAGGMLRSAHPEAGWLFIDLRTQSTPQAFSDSQAAAIAFSASLASLKKRTPATLHIPIRDFSVPALLPSFWCELASDIEKALAAGTNILVSCDGGHGRTGLVCSILLGKLDPDILNPVEHLRKHYCREAVETIPQEAYVYNMLGIPCSLPDPDPADDWLEYAELEEENLEEDFCEYCGITGPLDERGLCEDCQAEIDEK